jgi:AmmeMemoRadiSam system protein A
MIAIGDRLELLRLARDAIRGYLMGKPESPPARAAILESRAGVFVTLHRGDDLRGCIGHIEPLAPLGELIAQCAIAAASEDPRFVPVSAAELPELEIELSILGPLEAITSPADIEIGQHGLVVQHDARRGLLLPQVATEWNWNGETFLAQTCRKAGLPLDAWRHGAKLWRFEAEVFAEAQDGR